VVLDGKASVGKSKINVELIDCQHRNGTQPGVYKCSVNQSFITTQLCGALLASGPIAQVLVTSFPAANLSGCCRHQGGAILGRQRSARRAVAIATAINRHTPDLPVWPSERRTAMLTRFCDGLRVVFHGVNYNTPNGTLAVGPYVQV
jgi:hypothetical protein